jgi:hypothetical protein
MRMKSCGEPRAFLRGDPLMFALFASSSQHLNIALALSSRIKDNLIHCAYVAIHITAVGSFQPKGLGVLFLLYSLWSQPYL